MVMVSCWTFKYSITITAAAFETSIPSWTSITCVIPDTQDSCSFLKVYLHSHIAYIMDFITTKDHIPVLLDMVTVAFERSCCHARKCSYLHTNVALFE